VKRLPGILVRAYAALAALAVLAGAVTLGVLFASGALTLERVKAAAAELRRPSSPPPPTAAPGPVLSERRGARAEGPDAEARAEEQKRRALEEGLARRERELQKMEDMLRARLREAETSGMFQTEARARLEEERRAFAAEKAAWQASRIDEAMAANVPILSRMDGAAIVSVMKDWDDATVLRCLRALKPAKAVEALEAMKGDPATEPRFRRLSEAFGKTPQGY
jgi:hypothetical protein